MQIKGSKPNLRIIWQLVGGVLGTILGIMLLVFGFVFDGSWSSAPWFYFPVGGFALLVGVAYVSLSILQLRIHKQTKQLGRQ